MAISASYPNPITRLERTGYVLGYDEIRKNPACDHIDAVNRASLGARVNGGKLTDKIIGTWIRSMGISIQSKQVKVVNPVGGSEGGLIFIYNNNPPSESNAQSVDNAKKEQRIRFSRVNVDATQSLIDTLKRRFDAGTMPWVPLAEKFLVDKASEAPTQTQNNVDFLPVDLDLDLLANELVDKMSQRRSDPPQTVNAIKLSQGEHTGSPLQSLNTP